MGGAPFLENQDSEQLLESPNTVAGGNCLGVLSVPATAFL